MKILIVGAFPPPIGGITVHIKRLFDSLRDKGHQVEVYDFGGKPSPQKPDEVFSTYQKILQRLFYYMGKKHPDTILHIHVSAMGKFRWIGPILITIFRNYPKVITIHSGSFTNSVEGISNPGYIKWLLNSFDQIITVSKEQKDYLQDWGIPEEKIEIIPAFISQKPNSEALPGSVEKLLKEKKVLVLTSGYLTPLYNYDVLISAIEKLPAEEYGFMFAVYHQYDPDYESKIVARLSSLNNVILLRDLTPEVYLQVVKNCQIYVRATLRDGDSVAIREALQMGKTVFASDIVQRPAACQLFSAQDPGSLLNLFQEKQLQSPSPEDAGRPAGIEPILNVYLKARAYFQSKR